MTATAGVLVFRCDALRSKLTIASCAANYAAANGGGKAAPTDALRKGLYPRQAGLRPCVACPIGLEHSTTGKARSGLHLTVLRSEAPAPAEATTSKAFQDVKPEPAEAAVPREASAVPQMPASVLDGGEIIPIQAGSTRAAIVDELRAIVADRAASKPVRGTRWSERAMYLAVLLNETYGAKQKELEALGLNYFTVRGWVRAAKAASGMTAREIAAEGHAAKGGVPPEVRAAAIERLLNGEHPADVARALGVSEESVRRWRRDERIEKRSAARTLNKALDAAPKSSAPEAKAPEPIPYERPMPIDDEPEPPRAAPTPSQAATIDRAMKALAVCTSVALPSKPIGVDEDDIVEFCERAGLGFRETQAVIAIVLRNPAGALDILRREIARRGAA